MAVCPACEGNLDIEADDVEEGEMLDCPECGAELEVVNTKPLELNVVADEDEEEEEAEEAW